jgi:general stress protein 26
MTLSDETTSAIREAFADEKQKDDAAWGHVGRDFAASSVRKLLAVALSSFHEGILATIDPKGRPHAASMRMLPTPDFAHLLAVTGARADEVANIRANPKVEWMFTAPDRRTVIYIEGAAEILEDYAAESRSFQQLSEEDRVVFMGHDRGDGDRCVIKTRLDRAVHCLPVGYMKVRLDAREIHASPHAVE